MLCLRHRLALPGAGRRVPGNAKASMVCHIMRMSPDPSLLQVRALLDQEAIAQVVQYRKRKDHFIFTIGKKPGGV